jgi:hypothetical protein
VYYLAAALMKMLSMSNLMRNEHSSPNKCKVDKIQFVLSRVLGWKSFAVATLIAWIALVGLAFLCLYLSGNANPGQWVIAAALFTPLAFVGWLGIWGYSRMRKTEAVAFAATAVFMVTVAWQSVEICLIYSSPARVGEATLIAPGVLGIKLLWCSVAGIVIAELYDALAQFRRRPRDRMRP